MPRAVFGAVLLSAAWLDGAAAMAAPFDFLGDPAKFEIGETVLSWEPDHSYAKALAIGFINTVKITLAGIILATAIGFGVGLALVANHRLLRIAAQVYVEFHRNLPVLLHLFLWIALTRLLPSVRDAIDIGDIAFLSSRGLYLPALELRPGMGATLCLVAAGLIITVILVAVRYKTRLTAFHKGSVAALIGLLLVCLALEVRWDLPEPAGFNFRGGLHLTPEFLAVLAGVSAYASAFIAEIVRAGVQAVPKGQIEAGMALGLSSRAITYEIVMPQALRVIIPPTTSQYIALLKNSALGMVIGYTDFVNLAGTMINQTGRAPEIVLILMAGFLLLSSAISRVMNVLYQRVTYW